MSSQGLGLGKVFEGMQGLPEKSGSGTALQVGPVSHADAGGDGLENLPTPPDEPPMNDWLDGTPEGSKAVRQSTQPEASINHQNSIERRLKASQAAAHPISNALGGKQSPENDENQKQTKSVSTESQNTGQLFMTFCAQEIQAEIAAIKAPVSSAGGTVARAHSAGDANGKRRCMRPRSNTAHGDEVPTNEELPNYLTFKPPGSSLEVDGSPTTFHEGNSTMLEIPSPPAQNAWALSNGMLSSGSGNTPTVPPTTPAVGFPPVSENLAEKIEERIGQMLPVIGGGSSSNCGTSVSTGLTTFTETPGTPGITYTSQSTHPNIPHHSGFPLASITIADAVSQTTTVMPSALIHIEAPAVQQSRYLPLLPHGPILVGHQASPATILTGDPTLPLTPVVITGPPEAVTSQGTSAEDVAVASDHLSALPPSEISTADDSTGIQEETVTEAAVIPKRQATLYHKVQKGFKMLLNELGRSKSARVEGRHRQHRTLSRHASPQPSFKARLHIPPPSRRAKETAESEVSRGSQEPRLSELQLGLDSGANPDFIGTPSSAAAGCFVAPRGWHERFKQRFHDYRVRRAARKREAQMERNMKETRRIHDREARHQRDPTYTRWTSINHFREPAIIPVTLVE